MRSNVTCEPLPTLKEGIKALLDSFMSEQGYGDFFDLTKVIYSSNHEQIVRELIDQMEDLNDKAMRAEGLCSECGCGLENHHIPATRESLEENFPICSSPACRATYVRMVS